MLEAATREDILKAFNTDGSKVDVVTVIATKKFNLPYEEVTQQHRAYVKMEHHAQNYSMGSQIFRDILMREFTRRGYRS